MTMICAKYQVIVKQHTQIPEPALPAAYMPPLTKRRFELTHSNCLRFCSNHGKPYLKSIRSDSFRPAVLFVNLPLGL
jgi:hypothetical protein